MQWALEVCGGYFQMCAAAALVILAVFVLRLVLRRLPKNILCLLWLAVFFRLLCPVAVQGPIPDLWGWNPAGREAAADIGGLMADNQADTGKNDVYTGLPQGTGETENADGATAGAQQADGMQGKKETESRADGEEQDTDAGGRVPERAKSGDLWAMAGTFLQKLGEEFSGLSGADRAALVCGFAAMLGTVIYMILGIRRYAALVRLTRTAAVDAAVDAAMDAAMDAAVEKRRIRILECAGTPVPMVFGVLHPAVYLPTGFAEEVDVQERDLILRHEEAHIRRGDHLMKVLSWAALGIHWWNPLVWICAVLFQKDMEMACDEYVMAHAAEDMRAEYAGALLHFSMRRSGLVFPAAFGESNTQKRVRNVLRYHKRSAAFTVLALCIVGALTVCLATNPRTVEGSSGTGDDFSADLSKTEGKSVFASIEELGEYYRARWQEKFTAKNISVGTDAAGRDQVWYVGAEETEDSGEIFGADGWQQNAAEDIRYIEMTFCTMDSGTGIPTVYKTWVICQERSGEIYVENVEEESFERVETAEQARRMGSFPFWGYFGQDRERGANCAGVITDRGMLSSSMWQFELEEPESAAAMLLHLDGGSAAFQMNPKDGEESGYVVYTFADGGTVTYQMSRRVARRRGMYLREYWFPEGLMDEEIAREQVQRASLAEHCIESATAQALRDAVPIQQYMGDFENLQNGFVLLDQADGYDIALCGLLGGDAMVLRDGEECYPVYRYWTSPQMHLPQIYAGDYDGDGQEEYALWTHMGTGTGVSSSELYIIEKTENGITIQEFDRDALRKQFAGVEYDWDPEQQMLYMKVDGKRTGLSLSLKELLEEEGGEQLHFQGLDFHDISDFVERDGQWYYWTQSGTAVQEWAILDYTYGVEAEAPVIYKDGKFSLGEITLRKYGEKE